MLVGRTVPSPDSGALLKAMRTLTVVAVVSAEWEQGSCRTGLAWIAVLVRVIPQ